MDREGLSRLVMTIMAAGRVSELDLRDDRFVHAAVLRAVRPPVGDCLAERFGTSVSAVPDAAVGMRVGGLTQALWEAVSHGWLSPLSEQGCFRFQLTDCAARTFAAEVADLPEQEQCTVRQAGEAWAS